MTRPSYDALQKALGAVKRARQCIVQNRGLEKEQAREGYEHVVSEELVPALTRAIEDAAGDLEARTIERLAGIVMKIIRKELT